MCLVAEDGTLVRGTATGPRSPKALVSIRDSMWSAACSLCSVVSWDGDELFHLKENPPSAFLVVPFLLQRPLHEFRGKPSFFPLTLTLTLFYPSASLVNRSVPSALMTHTSVSLRHAQWPSRMALLVIPSCCGPVSFCLSAPTFSMFSGKPQSRVSSHTFLVLLLRPLPSRLATAPYSDQAHLAELCSEKVPFMLSSGFLKTHRLSMDPSHPAK